MKKFCALLLCSIFIVISFSACNQPSATELARRQAKLEEMKEGIEDYLAKTYPNETFTVNLWETYELIYQSTIPDHMGYMLHQVVTDSKGNRFQVSTNYKDIMHKPNKVTYKDDYAEVLNREVYYDKNGNRVLPL